MDSETTPGVENAPETPAAGPGEALRAAREAMRLDLSHIAAETRIPLRHLQAIEGGQFDALPSRTYAIGFARTYAKAVGLDPATITDAVRAELADGPMRRTVAAPGMEPGDPARLPSAGLAWAAGAAVLILAIGAFAFFRSVFGAGVEPGSLLPPEPAATATAAPAPAAAAPSGPVVLTATADGVWVRLYEEGGERLTERILKQGESLEVPPAARDPRINTGRPDALAVTIGGQPVAKLAETPQTIDGMPVSAAALVARGVAPAPEASASPPATETVPVRTRSRPRPRPQATSDATGAAPEASPAPVPAAPPAEAPAPTTR